MSTMSETRCPEELVRATSEEKPVLEPLCFPEEKSSLTNAQAPVVTTDSLNCLLCDRTFEDTGVRKSDALLHHLLLEHQLVIADVDVIADFKSYIQYWRKRFEESPITDICSVININTRAEDIGAKLQYNLLCDGLPEDKQIREELQFKKLQGILQCQQQERDDSHFSRDCLFCNIHFEGNRSVLFEHMVKDHGFNVGLPDNLVFVNALLDKLEEKLNNLQCLYCEKSFKDRQTLKDHMRKKQHKKINPKNKEFDKYYIINYLELGKSWHDILDEDDSEIRRKLRDEDWSDWKEESLTVHCLFCDVVSSVTQDLLKHMIECHSFDLLKIKKTLNLGFYEEVKIVNYIRRQVYNCKCMFCKEKFDSSTSLLRHQTEKSHFELPERKLSWDQPQYFFPTFENDGLLCGLPDDDDEEEDYFDSGATDDVNEDVLQDIAQQNLNVGVKDGNKDVQNDDTIPQNAPSECGDVKNNDNKNVDNCQNLGDGVERDCNKGNLDYGTQGCHEDESRDKFNNGKKLDNDHKDDCQAEDSDGAHDQSNHKDIDYSEDIKHKYDKHVEDNCSVTGGDHIGSNDKVGSDVKVDQTNDQSCDDCISDSDGDNKDDGLIQNNDADSEVKGVNGNDKDGTCSLVQNNDGNNENKGTGGNDKDGSFVQNNDGNNENKGNDATDKDGSLVQNNKALSEDKGTDGTDGNDKDGSLVQNNDAVSGDKGTDGDDKDGSLIQNNDAVSADKGSNDDDKDASLVQNNDGNNENKGTDGNDKDGSLVQNNDGNNQNKGTDGNDKDGSLVQNNDGNNENKGTVGNDKGGSLVQNNDAVSGDKGSNDDDKDASLVQNNDGNNEDKDSNGDTKDDSLVQNNDGNSEDKYTGDNHEVADTVGNGDVNCHINVCNDQQSD